MAAERVTAPRAAALETMRAVRSGDLADRALARACGALPPRDRAWVQELVYGTFRSRGRIDQLLDQLVRGGTEALEPEVLDILRLGAYQLLEMGSVPSYAAVSQSVELAREAGVGRASGLVNGVLQSLRRRQGELRFPDPEDDPVGDLVTRGSHPRWLVERWLARYGADGARELVAANNERPDLYLSVLGISTEEAVSRLRAAGLAADPVPFSPRSVRLGAETSARDALAVVPAVVQDPAAALVVSYADIPEGALVLDLCAAPGGKAVALTENAAMVVAADLSSRRLGRLRENVRRLGLEERVPLVVADARKPPFARADAVLLDAPCTGTGTFRRHPDGRWRITPADLEALTALQAELLAAAAESVREGGLLVYSTCSLEPEENEDRVRQFLESRPDFVLEPPGSAVNPALLTPDGCLRVLPQREGVDGSFAARLRRMA